MTDNLAETTSSSKTVISKVISNKMNKTIIVQVERKEKHPLYGKYIKKYTKMSAHDEDNTCQIGDLVMIAHTRPLSKTKRWKLVKVLEKQE